MITSRQNALIKSVRALSDKRQRDDKNEYLAEGVNTVEEALRFGRVKAIFATERGFAALVKRITPDLPVTLVSDGVFESISDEVSPQGVLAVVEKPANTLRAPKGNSLFLDGLTDPSNVGAVIRTAAAAGYNEVYLAGCADAYSPKSVRASMGGIFRVNIYTGDRERLAAAIDAPFYVADMSGENVFSFKSDDKFCLIIGSEAHGVSEYMRARATKTLSLDMQNGMESLNAAVAAGILMYALKNR